MDSNNSSIVENVLEESDFTMVSSNGNGMDDMKRMAEKVQKLEDLVMNKTKNMESDSAGMMQMSWQMGKEFGKMETNILAIGKENEKIKEELAAKGHLLIQMDMEMAKLKAKIDGNNAELEGKILEKFHKIDELKEGLNGLKEGMAKMTEENLELKAEYAKLVEKTRELEERIDELSMIEQINGIRWIKYNSNEYKMNGANGRKLTILEGGFVVKHSAAGIRGWNTVRSILPIPMCNSKVNKKPTIAFYYEVQILDKPEGSKEDGIFIGFCDQQFPMEGKWLGKVENSFGIWHKGEIRINGFKTELGNGCEWFQNGDFVGVGIIHLPNSKMECFATWNGEFLGKAELPTKFASIQIFPAVSLFYPGESVRTNFAKDSWRFKKFQDVIE